VKIEGLRVGYPGRTAPVIDGLTLRIRRGEFLAITGESGCGKTTLLHALAGLIAPVGGRVRLGGARTALVFQRPMLLPWRSVIDNLTFGLGCERRLTPPDRTQALALLASVGLGEVAQSRPRQLSEGMKQRVNLARALLVEPDLLLLDEPFAALDRLTRTRLQQDLLALRAERGFTTILVSHAADEVALLADRVLVVSGPPISGATEIAIDAPHPRGRELVLAQADNIDALGLKVAPTQEEDSCKTTGEQAGRRRLRRTRVGPGFSAMRSTTRTRT
jgi:NitT/TauT family transport system ATP-binding protein